jgi:hypothetical protein
VNARFSDDRIYRYELSRDVAPLDGDGILVVIGLNPSTADELRDDPTIRRCIGFARRWGFARLEMLNLYGYRATDPRELVGHRDPIGPDNDIAIDRVVQCADMVLVAWGARADPTRADAVAARLTDPFCLGLTVCGEPRHPLYVRADVVPMPYERRFPRSTVDT